MFLQARDLSGLGFGAVMEPIEYDILHNKLGYSDEAIRSMGQALADDIVADYGVGIERRPGQYLAPTDSTKVVGTAVKMREPGDVAKETFWKGVESDISKAGSLVPNMDDILAFLKKAKWFAIIGGVGLAALVVWPYIAAARAPGRALQKGLGK